MFILTEEGKLQNLYLLQNVITVDNGDGTFSVGYAQINGEVIKELSFNDKATVDAKVQSIINSLIS